MTKSLKTIQILAKAGKILSKITFVFSVICSCLCGVVLICMALGLGNFMLNGGFVIMNNSALPNNALQVATVWAAMGLIFFAGEAVLAKFAAKYFANELKAGTPFTNAGANELRRLGILTICLPLGSAIIAEITGGIIAGFMNININSLDEINYGGNTVALGIMFIVVSVICRFGAETVHNISAENASQKENN